MSEACFTGVYIMSNGNKTLYTGVSNNIVRRVLEHKQKKIKGFTLKYNLTLCFYYEFCENIGQAIIREKQIKNLSRAGRLELIQAHNPTFSDISSELFSLVENPDHVATFDPTPDKPE